MARRKWKEEEGKGERGGEDEKGGRGNRGCRWVLCTRWGLKFGDGTGGWRGRRAVVDEQEKGRRGWVIYFPPARHNLSRGFSREHAESTAIEEELGRREERGK